MKLFKIKNNKGLALRNSKGFALLFSVMLSSIILAITLGITSIAYKEIKFGTSVRDTNDAFFAADTGVECALYNDKISSNVFVAPPLNTGIMTCLGGPVTLTGTFPIKSFVITGLGARGQACAAVTVDKTSPTATYITSKGYNGGLDPCGVINSNQVQRQIELQY